MPSVLKRPVGGPESATKPTKRQAREDPTVAKCRLVVEALEQAEDIPQSARRMLQGMAADALSAAVEERHPFQATVVEMIGEAFRGMEARVEDDVAALQSKVDGSDEDKAAREAALVTAEQDLVSLKEASGKQQAVLQVEQAALSVAKKELAAAEKVQVHGDARFDQAADSLAKLEEGRTSFLEPIRAGSFGSENVDALTTFCNDVCFESVLVQALPAVLNKKPEDRVGFDLVVLEALEAEFKEHLEKYQAEVEAGAPAKEQRAEAALAATKAFDQATERATAADTAYAAALQALQDGDETLTAARTAVAQFFPDAKAVMDSYDRRKAQLAEMRQGFLATFKELRDRSLPPPPADPVEEAAAPAAPGGAAGPAEEAMEPAAPEEAPAEPGAAVEPEAAAAEPAVAEAVTEPAAPEEEGAAPA